MKRGMVSSSSFSTVNPSFNWNSPSNFRNYNNTNSNNNSNNNSNRSCYHCITSNGWKSVFILCILSILIVAIIMLSSSFPKPSRFIPYGERQSNEVIAQASKCPYVWHGGSPANNIKGSCWCSGIDQYCMCTPSLAIDGIIEYVPPNTTAGNRCDHCQIILVKRRDPPRDYYAIPGGFVNVGESTEEATVRELHEETHLTITKDCLEQFRWYSDPTRDPRRHTVSVVYRCLIHSIDKLKQGDDAKAVKAISLKDVLDLPLAFDHRHILTDYFQKYHPHYLKPQSKA